MESDEFPYGWPAKRNRDRSRSMSGHEWRRSNRAAQAVNNPRTRLHDENRSRTSAIVERFDLRRILCVALVALTSAACEIGMPRVTARTTADCSLRMAGQVKHIALVGSTERNRLQRFAANERAKTPARSSLALLSMGES